MARVFLLFRLAATEPNDDSLIPARSSRNRIMKDAIAEISNFSERPDATQIRQLLASISNVTIPKGQTTTDDAAEMSGHTGAAPN
jgi:hypothetical protein